MQLTTPCPVHPRHAELVEHLEEYLAAKGRSGRWLGRQVAKDFRLVPNLKRGQAYPPAVMLALWERLCAFYEEQLAQEWAQVRRAA